MLLSSTRLGLEDKVGGGEIQVRIRSHQHRRIEPTCMLMTQATYTQPQPSQQANIIAYNPRGTMSDPRISIQSLVSKDSPLRQNEEERDRTRNIVNQDQQPSHPGTNHHDSRNTQNMNSVPSLPLFQMPQHPYHQPQQLQHQYQGGHTPTVFQTYLEQPPQSQPRPWYPHNSPMYQHQPQPQPQQLPHPSQISMTIPPVNPSSMEYLNAQRPMMFPAYHYISQHQPPQQLQQQLLNPIYMPVPMQDMGNLMCQDTASISQPFASSFPLHQGPPAHPSHSMNLNMPLPPLPGQTHSHPVDQSFSPGTMMAAARTSITGPDSRIDGDRVGPTSGPVDGLLAPAPTVHANEPIVPAFGVSVSSGSKAVALPVSGMTPSTNPALRKRRSRKSTWMQEEDDLLLCCVTKHGQSWSFIANKYFSGEHNRQFVRSAGQLRTRYVDHLEPDRKVVEWSESEEMQLVQLHETYGNKWKEISEAMVGRSANDVKNRFRKLERNRRKRKRRIEQGLFAGGAGMSNVQDGMDAKHGKNESDEKNDKHGKNGDDSESYDGSEDEESRSSIGDDPMKHNESGSVPAAGSPSASRSAAGPSNQTI